LDPSAILFPFTWLPETHLAALLRHFSRPVVLAPSDRGVAPSLTEWDASGRIELRTPIRGDGKRLSDILKDFRHWAEAHRGADLSLARILEGSIPFFDDSHVARIRSEIRRGASGSDDAGLDRLTRARVFLLMAEHYDRERQELETDLEAFKALETSMLSELRDVDAETDPPAGAARGGAEDPGRFMIEERLRAWAQLYLEDEVGQDAPTVLVTPSRAAVETMLEVVSEPGEWTEARISGGIEHTTAAVSALAAGKPVDSAPAAAAGEPLLFLFRVPEAGPRRLFGRFFGAESTAGGDDGASRGTLLAWIDINY
jgi:hypothetical protein